MMRGRPPKPAEIKMLNGNPGKRPIPETIKGSPGRPRLNLELTPEAKSEFDRLCSILESMGILYESDGPTIEMYLSAWQMAHDAEVSIRAEGVMVDRPTRHGVMRIKHPAFDVWSTATRIMQPLLSRFGLDPSSRMRLPVDAPSEDPEVEVLNRLKGTMS